MKVVQYTRVGKGPTSQVSAEAQAKSCQDLADEKGLVITEQVSHNGRPAFDAMLASMGQGDVVITSGLDRLTRNSGDLERLLDKGVRVVVPRFDSASPQEKFMLRLMTIMKEQESIDHGHRIKAGKALKARQA